MPASAYHTYDQKFSTQWMGKKQETQQPPAAQSLGPWPPHPSGPNPQNCSFQETREADLEASQYDSLTHYHISYGNAEHYMVHISTLILDHFGK